MTQSPVRPRRGLVGSTNLASPTRECGSGQPAAHTPAKTSTYKQPSGNATSPRGEGVSMGRKRKTAGTGAGRVGEQPGSGAAVAGEGGAVGGSSLRHARRDQFRLPLVSSLASSGASSASAGAPEPTAEAQLARNIDDYERRSKSFKAERWYKSPIGCGSNKAVLLVALQQRDLDATGQIHRADIETALGGAIFELKPGHIRDLLADCAADSRALVDYRQFVDKLKLPPERPEQDPLIYRQQSYIEKIRARSQALLQQASPQSSPVADATAQSFTAGFDRNPQPPSILLPLVSPVQTGPRRDAVRGTSGRDEDSRVLPPLISPLRAIPEPPSPNSNNTEVDWLSFEHDKQRKQRRADAKARTLLAHLNRVDEYSRRQQQLAEIHDSVRLAVKALHRQEHFERAFDEENRVLRIAQRQGKGGLRSEYSQMHRNVSTDSMFNVEPVRPTR